MELVSSPVINSTGVFVTEPDEVDTTVNDWVTAHADLHWGNLTAPDCYLLDWGAAPRGRDAVTLWGVSLQVPELAARVQREFQTDLQTRSGKLAQLLFCSNVIRVNAKRTDPSPLVEPAKRFAEMLLADLRAGPDQASCHGPAEQVCC
ncbi:MAG: hypothetical protein ACRDQ4_04915 [Pseudonocardiaceae bacterium]